MAQLTAVLLSTCNAASYLSEQLDSVLDQTSPTSCWSSASVTMVQGVTCEICGLTAAGPIDNLF
ncbi:MAG TPA: hypothetical protein ENF28_07990 [Proteobacteria bacterium]|nr:hypothetical protein [Pseudomonadota bacterium]